MSGTTTKSRDNFGHDSSGSRDLMLQHQKVIDDLQNLSRAVRSVALTTSGLAIKAASNVLAKSATAFRYIAQPSGTLSAAPVLGLVAANTDTAAFSGTVTNTKFNVFVHTVSDDGAGTKTHRTRMGTEGATRAAVVFPTIGAGEVVYGVTEINPTGTGSFVGGTTALDDATVVPNAVFISIVGDVPGLGLMNADSALTGAKIGDASGTAFTA